MKFDEILTIAPYSLEREEKGQLLTKRLRELTIHHQRNCEAYRKIIDFLGVDVEKITDYHDILFLPVRLFKDMQLRSVAKTDIVKTMTSSGTTGSGVSQIYLDKNTSLNQQKTLVKIVSDFTRKERMPMLIIDSPEVIRNRSMFSARGAGILGFAIMATERKYALDRELSLNLEEIREFLKKHAGKRIFLFGFTFMIWQYFYKELLKQGEKLDLSNAILIHGGGWKKLEKEAVSPEQFKECLKDVCGITEIYDYYGMVEQTGCIYMQCNCGHLHASIFSDVIVRRTKDFSVADIGEKGVVQVLSLLPESYPGHSILTEDTGIILGEDDCPCGRKGKYFKLTGRIKNAEIRGCSDAYEN
ncbi:acyl-protein synthetase [Lachnospiraceae bacterium 45-W7]